VSLTGASLVDVWRDRLLLCLRQGGAALLLLVLGLVASVAVTLYMTAAPLVSEASADCGESGGSPSWLVGEGSFTASDCKWEKAVEQLATDTSVNPQTRLNRHISISQPAGSKPVVRLTARAPATSALVRALTRGDAGKDVISFVETVWGTPLLDGNLPDWQFPELTLRPSDRTTKIEVDGTFPVRAGTLNLYADGPFVVDVTLTDERLAAVRTSQHVTVQDSRHLTVRSTGEEYRKFSIDLATGGAPGSNSDYNSRRATLRRMLPWLWSEARRLGDTLSTAGGAVLSAAGWLALLLAARAGVLGPWNGDGPRRLIRVSGVVLTAHCVLWAAAALDSAFGFVDFTEVPWGYWLPSLLGGPVMAYAPVTGVVVLLTCASLVLLPAAVLTLRQDTAPPAPHAPRRPRTVLAVAVLAVVALLGAAGVLTLMANAVGAASGPSLLLPILLCAILAIISALVVRVGRKVGWRLRLLPLVAGSAFVPLFAIGAELTDLLGILPQIVDWAVPVAAGTVAITATAGLAAVALGSDSRFSRRYLVLLFPVAVALAAVWHRARSESPSWWDFTGLGQWLDALGGLVLVAATLRALRHLGAGALVRPSVLRQHRALGIVLVFTSAAGSIALSTQPSAVEVAAAAVMAWLLFPYAQIRRAAAVLAQNAEQREGALRRAVRSGTARRSLPAARKAAREAISEGPRSYATAHRTLRAVEDSSFEQGLVLPSGITVSGRQLAFGAFLGPVPWRRALRTARLAALIGAPWTVLSISGAALATIGHDAHPVLALSAVLLPILLNWAGFGLLYGYFFPLLRGTTGFSKALCLYGVIVVPAVSRVLTSPHPSHWSSWTQTLLFALESLAFAMTLGLRTDSEVLTAHRMRPARLADIHNLGAITAWWSSVAIALATGVATFIMAGLQPFLLDVFPQHAPQPAPVTTPRATPDGSP
jgi:hypothetical protein